jgi:hypothetical protein
MDDPHRFWAPTISIEAGALALHVGGGQPGATSRVRLGVIEVPFCVSHD